MPQFASGELKNATAPILAKPSGIACEAELFLGPDSNTKVATSGRVPFVSTGASQNVSLPITMPAALGAYHGYIDVFAEGLRFLAYITTEDVVIARLGEFTVRITNYDELLQNSQESASTYGKPLAAQWYAEIPSIVLDPVSRVPLNYLQPAGVGIYRPLDEVCRMVITEEMAGYSQYWHPEGKPPKTKLIIPAGPLRAQVVEGYQLWGYGVVFESSLVEVTPGCTFTFDYGRKRLEVG